MTALTHQTTSQSHTAPAQPTLSAKALLQSDDEALARMLLTHCSECANALMTSLLKGCDSEHPGVEALRALLMVACATTEQEQRRARNTLECMFILGTARWGRKARSEGVASFQLASQRWIGRLLQLPTFDPDALCALFTGQGAYTVVIPGSPYWPESLEDLDVRSDWAPPLALWVQGDATALTSCDRPVSIVGSRGVNEYGRHVARNLACQTALNGHLVVSGGAMGIDAAAHWGALEAMNQLGAKVAGRTVAIFAGGLDHCGPTTNMRLFEQICAQHGALVSECTPSTIPEPRRFLLRNRLIAALAYSVVVAQARLRYGALNTAGWANEMNRRLFAVPGEITTPAHAGCNRLIADQQASLLSSTSDIEQLCHETHAPSIRP